MQQYEQINSDVSVCNGCILLEKERTEGMGECGGGSERVRKFQFITWFWHECKMFECDRGNMLKKCMIDAVWIGVENMKSIWNDGRMGFDDLCVCVSNLWSVY